MGTRGPVAQPSSTRDRRFRINLDGAALPTQPTRPEWLEETKQAWQEFWRSRLARAVARVDLPELYTLFDLRDQRSRLLGQLAAESVVVTGSRGQPAVNPALRALTILGGQIERGCDKFGLSPAARARLGVDSAGGTSNDDAEAGRLDAILGGDDA